MNLKPLDSFKWKNSLLLTAESILFDRGICMDKSTSIMLAGFIMIITGIYLDFLISIAFNMANSGIDPGPRFIPFIGTPFICPLGVAIMIAGLLMRQNVIVNARRFLILFLLSELMFIFLRIFWLVW